MFVPCELVSNVELRVLSAHRDCAIRLFCAAVVVGYSLWFHRSQGRLGTA